MQKYKVLREVEGSDNYSCHKRYQSCNWKWDKRNYYEGVEMVPIAKLAFGRLLQLMIASLLAGGWVMSCHSSQPRADVQTQNKTLEERVNALQYEPLGPIDLGNAIAAPSENTEYIIAQKDQAVPLLIEALKDDKKPSQVGYAAYCLRRIGSDKGKEVAAAAYDKLLKRGEQIRIEERFARTELKNYLDFLQAEKR